MNNVYELIYMIKQKDEYSYSIIIEQYRYLLMKIISDFAARFPFIKAHKEDILQETFISVFETIEHYRDDQNTQFKTFLITCVNRKIQAIIKQLFNQKNYVMINALSLDDCINEDGDLYGADVNASEDVYVDPIFVYKYRDAVNKFKTYYDNLNDEDKLILNFSINKINYDKAARFLKCSHKTYDNKVQRVKRNLKKAVYY